MSNSKESKVVILLFGGAGDLAKRKLYPSLFNLYKKGFIQKHFAVIGTSRRKLTDNTFQEIVYDSVSKTNFVGKAREFASHFHFISHNIMDLNDYPKLNDLMNKLDSDYQADGNRIFYMSVAPRFFGQIAEAINSEGLISNKGYNRLMIEKPFGTSYNTAKKLQDQLEKGFSENQIYRTDHYLGKEMVQNIPAIRFGNPFLEKTWNRNYIKCVQVTLAEKLGVEERAGYYNKTGALLDMVQNHLFQIVGWIAMEKPFTFKDKDVLDAKNATLSTLKIYNKDGVKKNFIRGQYGKGPNDLKAYTEEENVPKDSKNNTYVAGRLQFNSDRWKGVPFYIRTGKRLSDKQNRIDIVYKKPTFNFNGINKNELPNPILTIIIDPAGKIELSLNGKNVTSGFQIRSNLLKWEASKEDKEKIPLPYENLFHDAMEGNGSNFADWRNISTSWKFIDPIANVWNKNEAPLNIYRSLSMGPKKTDQLLAETNDHWVFKG